MRISNATAAMSFSGLLIIASGCSGARSPGEAAHPPNWEPKGGSKCSVKASQTKPLVVEWPGQDRGLLETQARRGVIVVRYDGCEMEVLSRCTAPVQYHYAAISPKLNIESIRNEDELHAKVPIGAARLEGKLQQFGELNVRMTMVGRWEAAKTELKKSELQGADCERATHMITGMTVGAFSFYAGAASEDSGGASVAGVGAGAKSSRGSENLSQDGDPARCAEASDQDKEPVRNCSAVIGVEVAELGEAQTVCPEGTEQRGGQCVRKEVVTEVQCPAGTTRQGGKCVASVDTSCAAGMHFEAGRGCVANVVAAPPRTAAPPQPASPPPASTPAPPSGGGTSCGSGRYVVLQQPTSGDNQDGSGLVRDTRTGLVWMSKSYRRSSGLNQAAAAAYCREKGMRLPTKDEALGIAAGNRETCAFPDSWWTWTSTSAGSGRAWYVSYIGLTFEGAVDFSHHVRCVR